MKKIYILYPINFDIISIFYNLKIFIIYIKIHRLHLFLIYKIFSNKKIFFSIIYTILLHKVFLINLIDSSFIKDIINIRVTLVVF